MTRLVALLAAGILGAAACGSDAGSGPSTIDITGSITYRQRIALVPGSVATITLEDVSQADAASTTIAEQTIQIDDQQVPIPFRLTVDGDALDERNSYSVRATITRPDGALAWTTDTASLIDPTEQEIDLGELVMVQVSTDTAVSPLQGTWTIVDVDGEPTLPDVEATLVFGDDGRLSGNASCNDYSTSFQVDASTLTLGPIAITQKACVPDRGDQEAAVLTVLNDLAEFEIVDANTQLILTSSTGSRLTARR